MEPTPHARPSLWISLSHSRNQWIRESLELHSLRWNINSFHKLLRARLLITFGASDYMGQDAGADRNLGFDMMSPWSIISESSVIGWGRGLQGNEQLVVSAWRGTRMARASESLGGLVTCDSLSRQLGIGLVFLTRNYPCNLSTGSAP